MGREYLLLLRFAILNLAALGLLAGAWAQGWVQMIARLDITHLSLVITGVFLVGWSICIHKIVRCTQELNAVRRPGEAALTRVRWYVRLVDEAGPGARGAMADCLRSRLYARISLIRPISNTLVILGLIGTVVGFIIALGGVNADSVSDMDAVAPMVSTLIQGMSVALFTTLVGSVFHVWLTMCYQVLATGTVNLANAIIERAEAPGYHEPFELL